MDDYKSRSKTTVRITVMSKQDKRKKDFTITRTVYPNGTVRTSSNAFRKAGEIELKKLCSKNSLFFSDKKYLSEI
jgi:hypothetical protein